MEEHLTWWGTGWEPRILGAAVGVILGGLLVFKIRMRDEKWWVMLACGVALGAKPDLMWHPIVCAVAGMGTLLIVLMALRSSQPIRRNTAPPSLDRRVQGQMVVVDDYPEDVMKEQEEWVKNSG